MMGVWSRCLIKWNVLRLKHVTLIAAVCVCVSMCVLKCCCVLDGNDILEVLWHVCFIGKTACQRSYKNLFIVTVCFCRWLVFSDPGFQGLLAVLEEGVYLCPEDWGFPTPFIGSLRPLKMVNTYSFHLFKFIFFSSFKRKSSTPREFIYLLYLLTCPCHPNLYDFSAEHQMFKGIFCMKLKCIGTRQFRFNKTLKAWPR